MHPAILWKLIKTDFSENICNKNPGTKIGGKLGFSVTSMGENWTLQRTTMGWLNGGENDVF